ncbi:uncharacterized protein stbd1 isoform X2 [Hippocampus comes]|uniref:Starch binding domain 1 n=1 Tax=Hippocampus comes TaxID=109280 RepID=A0A3Q2XZK6_HIPCM|nr:PREDICTED: starch-binding domain-containing protein 1 isoform X2 [Hippocampus comes]
MAFKGSNGVAVERRADLASLFCMIGRHGPAVALAVFAVVSVLAGFVIYRTVRGRRRRKKKTTAGSETDRKSSLAESDEAVTQSELEPQACATSTDDDVAKEEHDPAEAHHQVRRRAAAAAEKNSSPCETDSQTPANQHATSLRVESASSTEAHVYSEEPSQSLPSVAAEIQRGSASVYHPITTDYTIKDKEISDGNLKEPEAIQDRMCQEVEQHEEDQTVNTDADSYKKTRQEPLSSNPERFEETLPKRDEEDQNKQDDKNAADTGMAELNLDVVSIEKSPNEDFEEAMKHQDGADPNVYSYFRLPEVTTEEQEFDGSNTLSDEAIAEGFDGLSNTAFDFDSESPESDNREIQAECEEEQSLMSHQEMNLLPDGGRGESCNMDGNSGVPPVVDADMPDVTSETTPQIDSDVSPHDQQEQKVDLPTVEDETEKLSGLTEKDSFATEGEAPVDHLCEPRVLSSHKEQQSVQELDHAALKKAKVALIPNLASDNGASIDKDQYGDNGEKSKTFGEPRFDSAGDDPSHAASTSSAQDQQTDPNVDFPVAFSAPAPVLTEHRMNLLPKLQICLPLFQPSELRENDTCEGGEESGISSMAVSPEMLEPGSHFDTTEMPAIDHESQVEARLQPPTCLLPDNATLSVLEEDGVVYEPHPAPLPEQPYSQNTECAHVESLATNEDMLGPLVGEGNQRESDVFTMPVQSDEWQRSSDVKVAEVSSEKLECAEKKEAPMAKDEDFVKTEINIMEATMDHNEWITDGNPNFPWMNLSAPSFGGENHQATQQLATEECNHSDSQPRDVPRAKQTAGCDFEENEKSQKVNVTFCVHYITKSPLQILAVTGNRRELGNWKRFIPLESAKDGHWEAVVGLPAENHVQWKFVVVEQGQVCRWEECGNRLLDTGCGEDLLVHKFWGFP